MKLFAPTLTCLALALCFYAFVPGATTATTDKGQLEWLSWEEAMQRQEQAPRKILVDVYTDWCGWCKRMDANTFEDPKIAAYLNEHFYVVKLDAEQKETIKWRGNDFVYRPDAGRRGIHTLAYSLLEGRMSYPSIVYLDEVVNRISISPGYKTPEQIMPELTYVVEEGYKSMTLDEFKKRTK